jgi:hypothetical protein
MMWNKGRAGEKPKKRGTEGKIVQGGWIPNCPLSSKFVEYVFFGQFLMRQLFSKRQIRTLAFFNHSFVLH